VGLPLIDLSALPTEMRETEGRRAMFDRTRAVFDLERGPLIRAALVRLGAGDWFWLLTVHHTATDWITFQIIFQELMALYEAARAGRPSLLPEPELQFPDYALWERDWWSGEALEEYAGFWRRELAGFPLALCRETGRARRCRASAAA
jgi:hypothetical protein